jgi:hypothetical protein
MDLLPLKSIIPVSLFRPIARSLRRRLKATEVRNRVTKLALSVVDIRLVRGQGQSIEAL